MATIDARDVMNDIYQLSLSLGVAAVINMVLQKFAKMSLGTPMSLKPFYNDEHCTWCWAICFKDVRNKI